MASTCYLTSALSLLAWISKVWLTSCLINRLNVTVDPCNTVHSTLMQLTYCIYIHLFTYPACKILSKLAVAVNTLFVSNWKSSSRFSLAMRTHRSTVSKSKLPSAGLQRWRFRFEAASNLTQQQKRLELSRNKEQ